MTPRACPKASASSSARSCAATGSRSSSAPGADGFSSSARRSSHGAALIGLEIRRKWASIVDGRLAAKGFGARARVFAEDARFALPATRPRPRRASLLRPFPRSMVEEATRQAVARAGRLPRRDCAAPRAAWRALRADGRRGARDGLRGARSARRSLRSRRRRARLPAPRREPVRRAQLARAPRDRRRPPRPPPPLEATA